MADPEKKPEGGAGAASGMTLEQVTSIVAELAPAVAKLTEAFAGLKPAAPAAAVVPEGEDTKPVAPAAGAAAAPADASAMPAKTEDTVAAMDAKVKGLAAKVEELTKNATRTVMADIARRDALVSRLTPHIGAFDHAEKTLAEVAVYGCEKLQIKVAADSALPALEGYLTAKPSATPASRAVVGADSALGHSGMVQAFINGTTAK